MVNIFGPLLSQKDRRLALIRNLGSTLSRRGWDSILQAGDYCQNHVRLQTPNLLGVLAEFNAYADPVEKKSVFFLALMHNCGLWNYVDNAELPAPVDYHEVRGHLRIGTVALHGDLREKVMAGVAVSDNEDVAIRMAVREAIQVIADNVGRSPNALHYLFWNLFRTYCTRKTPQCGGASFGKLPADYARAVKSVGGDRCCPFASLCDSVNSELAIDEHKIETEYY